MSFLLVFSLAMPAVGAVDNIDISEETSIQIENESEIEESEQEEVTEGEGDEEEESEEPKEPSESDVTEEESDEDPGVEIDLQNKNQEKTQSGDRSEDIKEKVEQAIEETKKYYLQNPPDHSFQGENYITSSHSDFWIYSALWGAGFRDLKNDFQWKSEDSSPWADHTYWTIGEKKGLGGLAHKERPGAIIGALLLGKDPRNFGNTEYRRDLVDDLISMQKDDGGFSDSFGEPWAMIALELTDADYNKEKHLQHILSKQNNDTGSFGGADVAGWTLTALAPYIDNREDVKVAVKDAVNSIHETFKDRDEYPGMSGANSNSTAAIVMGLAAVGEDLYSDKWRKEDGSLIEQLLAYQLEDGSFKWKASDAQANLMATEQVLLALATVSNEESLYIQLKEYKQEAQSIKTNVSIRIEGIKETLLFDEEFVVETLEQATALDATKQALTAAHIPFEESGGVISSIDGEEQGTFETWDGWQYLVNEIHSAEDLADDFPITNGDEIVWFYGNESDLYMGWDDADEIDKLTLRSKVSVSPQVYEGDEIEVKVTAEYRIWEESFELVEDKVLTNVKDAAVHFNGEIYKTDENGIARIPGEKAKVGTYEIRVTKDIENSYPKLLRQSKKIIVSEKPDDESSLTIALNVDGINIPILEKQLVRITKKQTVLDVLKQELDNAKIPYGLVESSFGSYVQSINKEEAGHFGGWDGWMYTVNGEAPEVGADVYELEEGDQLRFYYSRWAAISSDTKIENGTENPTVTVKLVGDTFSPEVTAQDSWKIDTGTTGLKVKSIKKVKNQEATVEFSGKAKAGSLSIQALKAALEGEEPSEAISIKVKETDDLLTDMINDTIDYYKATGRQLSGWTNLVALWGTGEDILDGTWELPSWESTDPGLVPNDGDTAHIRYIFGLLAMDKNPTNAWETNRNLYAELAAQQTDNGNIGSVNKHIWAMLALDTGERMGHDVGAWNEEKKQQALDYLLTQEKTEGGFAFFGSVADIDMTGMGLLALANYQGNSAADAAIERAKGILKAKHLDKTGPGLSESSNSLATAITGLVAVGEDLLSDEWIVNGQSVIDQLKIYQLEDGSFKYLSNQSNGNEMATEQSLVALQDIQAGKTVWERLSERELSEQDPVNVQVTEKEYTLEEKLQKNISTPVILQFESMVLPKVTAVRGNTTLEIPAGTNIKSEDWDEKLQVPTTRNTNVSGLREKIDAQLKDKEVERVDLRIKVGGEKRIDFDNHVTLKLKGQSGKDTGFIDADGTFEVIEKYPNADLRNVDVYAYDSGDDLIIKTKHFTEFLAFKATLIEAEEPGTGGGGNGGGGTSPTTKTVTVSVEKRSIGEGDIIPSTDVSLETGDTAYDVLKRVANQKGISINSSGSGASLYVKAIDGLAEFDHGTRSGWMYSVNGTFPSSSAGSYTIKDGDVVRWQYTTTLGEEIGGGSSGGGGAAPSPGPTPENPEAPEKPENQPTAMQPLIDDAAKWMQSNRDFSTYDEFNDWDVLALARAGKEVPALYYGIIEKHVKENNGEFRLVTDYERIALTVTALGKDARNIAGYDFIEKIYNNERMTNQGTNGALFALLALDAQDAEVPANAIWTRDRLLKWLIDQQNDDGGFPLSKEAGSGSDLDITAMVLQALAKYQDRKDVKEVTEKALLWISEQQLANGGFIVWDEENSESVSQVIIGLTSLGISLEDERFVKTDGDLLTAFTSFINKDGGIAHTKGEASNYMATQQGLLALAANDRLLKKKKRIYDMTDITPGEVPEEEITFSDLDEKHFAYKEIMEMVDAGIISGYRDGTFRPDDRLIRGQAAILFARALDLEFPANPQGFQELSKSSTFYEAAHATKAAGVFAGKKDGTFGAQDELTREQMASVLVRAFDLKGTGEKVPFKDLDKVSKAHREDVAILYQNGITAGRSNGTFDPRSSVSRAQFSAFLYRALEK